MKKITKSQLKNIKDWIKFALAILCVFIFVVFYIFNLWSPIRTPVTVVVERGMSVTGVTNYLVKHNIIKSANLFYLSIRLNGGMVQAGEYDIPRGAGVWTIANILTHGKIASTTVTIPEGYTIVQIKKMLKSVPDLAGDVDCDKDIPVCSLKDGDVYPDTYRVARGTARLAVLDLARKKMDNVKKKISESKLPEPLTNMNQVLILASIVQKETPLKREMPVVAGVYLNRLRINMKLQACPTVVYAITNGEGDMHQKPLLSEHLKTVSPYNTYLNYGLPPKPIANVGMDAIRAVLKPARTDYLFFVANGRGGHKFSKTFSEHEKNHAVWREIKKELNK